MKFAVALVVSFVLMILFRALVLTVYTVEGTALSPQLLAGDRVLVNRWSYGLRVGSTGSLFGYHRLCRQPVEHGDLVVFDNPRNTSDVLICRCRAVPGDSVNHGGQTLIVPGRADCADNDYYWLEALSDDNPLDSRQLGFISEEHIIGRVTHIVYSHHPDSTILRGWRAHRVMKAL